MKNKENKNKTRVIKINNISSYQNYGFFKILIGTIFTIYLQLMFLFYKILCNNKRECSLSNQNCNE